MRPSLTITPDEDAIVAFASAWAWLLSVPFEPLLFSALGDVFLRDDTGEVFWLDTGTAELSRVATSEAEFAEHLAGEAGVYWLMPDLVEELAAAGKILRPGWCYTFVILPIFKEGGYQVDNLNPVPAAEHLSLTGEMHQQLRALPDGAKVKLQIVP
jgi:hypothetical protein